ncbi:MAG: LacI family transcription regulator [Pseudonocardiales bacterium]|nr:LacI family transcription regulator [Pseudonocardiales bacterium]
MRHVNYVRVSGQTYRPIPSTYWPRSRPVDSVRGVDVTPERPRAQRSRPTLADVAVAAGVSRTTASNAYNRPDQLSKAQREKVLAVAAELGYAGPDPVARSLRTRSADAVGLIFSAQLSTAFSDPAAVEFLHGVAQACEERDRSLLLVPAGPDAKNTAMVARAAVDGFLIYSMPEGDPHIDAVLARPQAAVVVDSPTNIADASFVGIDDRAAFTKIAEHVLELGHRRLAFVCMGAAMPERSVWTDWRTTPVELHAVYRERVLGLSDALCAIEPATNAAVWVRTGRVNSYEAGRSVAAELMELDEPPTAILCTSDVLAFGVLAELADRGVDVPRQVTVTGFDDVPEAGQRGLTTVSQPTHEKGYLAAGLLLDFAAGTRTEEQRLILATRLVVRTTSGPVGAQG